MLTRGTLSYPLEFSFSKNIFLTPPCKNNKIQLPGRTAYGCTPVYRKRGDGNQSSRPCSRGPWLHLYQRRYSSSLKNPLSFYNFRILLITHSFSIMTSDCNPVHKPLSQTPPWSPPQPPVTDGVYRGNFHRSRSLLMLIVKSVWDVPGSFITWRHNGNLHFIRMPSSAHGSWLAKGHSLEQREQRSEVLSVPAIRGRTNLVSGAPLLCSARARPSSTWTHVTECGGSSSEVPCRLAGCVCPSRCIVQAFTMGAEGPYPLGTQIVCTVLLHQVRSLGNAMVWWGVLTKQLTAGSWVRATEPKRKNLCPNSRQAEV